VRKVVVAVVEVVGVVVDGLAVVNERGVVAHWWLRWW
jgi:hypothetical protein